MSGHNNRRSGTTAHLSFHVAALRKSTSSRRIPKQDVCVHKYYEDHREICGSTFFGVFLRSACLHKSARTDARENGGKACYQTSRDRGHQAEKEVVFQSRRRAHELFRL